MNTIRTSLFHSHVALLHHSKCSHSANFKPALLPFATRTETDKELRSVCASLPTKNSKPKFSSSA